MNIYLDTETTGLNDNAEIIQISIINEDGDVLLDTLVKCQESIPRAASEIHGITKKTLASASEWPDVYKQVISLLNDAEKVFIYNADFDCRILAQTCERHHLSAPQLNAMCIMKLYARMFNRGYFRKLTAACYDLRIDISDVLAHSAVGDSEMTRRLHLRLQSIIENENRQERRREIAQKSRDKISRRKRSYLPKKPDDYPYFGQSKRPEGYKSLSRIPLKDMPNYEFVGMCCDCYGTRGYLFKPVVTPTST